MRKLIAALCILPLAGCSSISIAPSDLNATYPLAVDYQKPLRTLIDDCGLFWVNSNITAKNFPNRTIGNGQLTAVLVKLGPFAEAENVEKELASSGYRAATLYELLAFSRTYPDVQKEKVIVALGSHCQLVSASSRPSTAAIAASRSSGGSVFNARNAPQTFYPCLSNELGNIILDMADAELIHPRSATISIIYALFVSE